MSINRRIILTSTEIFHSCPLHKQVPCNGQELENLTLCEYKKYRHPGRVTRKWRAATGSCGKELLGWW